MLIVSAVLVLIGGIVEIIPMMMIDKNVPKIASIQPYTPLEIEGRDIYIREGCRMSLTNGETIQIRNRAIW